MLESAARSKGPARDQLAHQRPPAEWNDTAADYPRDRTVHQLVEAQAARSPDAVAAEFGGRSITYRELNASANRLAHHLRSLGVGPDVLVAICVERSLDMLTGVLGILKAGGAYVPLDPTYPAERLAFMVDDARPLVIVAHDRIAQDLPVGDSHLVFLDACREAIAAQPDHDLDTGVVPENRAYVIYTSGSTGKPKGVEVTHRSVVNFLWSMHREPGLTADDALVAVTTLSFDIAGLELFLPLVVGARVVIAPSDVVGDGRRLIDLLNGSGATAMQATPATWRLLLECGWEGSAGLKILCGGEALTAPLAAALLERGASLWNLYGPTETTIWSTVHHLQAIDGQVPVGRPIANTQVHVLDEDLQPVAVGCEGELHIGGDGMARGYLNRPELTAERFLSDPFRDEPGARLYKTGDLARFRDDGTLEFLGRLDHQVKIRGYRVELGEIESALEDHPHVRSAVVIARAEEDAEARLVAYVVPEHGATLAPNELRRFVGEKLPAYMVPATVMTLDTFPLTPNGKVDRNALPSPTHARASADGYVAPRGLIERDLVEIWEDVLGVRPVGVRDNFWDLGIDSLTAASLFARIERDYYTRLPLAPVFQAPTIERLADLVQNGQQRDRSSSLVTIQPHGSRPPLFCVHGGAGTVLHFRTLARHLGSEQPFYGLQSRGLYGRVTPRVRFEEMAADYIAEIRTVQLAGPYLLAGHCFGGVIAYEMAQQLRAQGEDVALLAMFNTLTPTYDEGSGAMDDDDASVTAGDRPSRSTQQGSSVRERVARARRAQPDQPAWRATARVARTVRRKARNKLVRSGEDVGLWVFLHFRLPVPDRLRTQFFRLNHSRAAQLYEMKPYPGRVTIFTLRGMYEQRDLGWAQFAGDLEIHEIEARSYRGRELTEGEGARQLASLLLECVDRAPVTPTRRG